MSSLPVNVIRYGREEPLPDQIPLRAGPLSLIYSDGDLRIIRLGSEEILRRLYVAVRDRNWNTIPAALSNVQIDDRGDSFQISYDADHREGEIDFYWHSVITGESDGTIRFDMDGEARSTFLRNRIGFCILHPAELAGASCTVEHVDGEVEESAFPDQISPHQPFFDIRAITHQVHGGVRAEVRMVGDTFEMEDQRNWTDASYKTYCTPLALPFPVEVAAGTPIRQTVTLTLAGDVSNGVDTSEPALTFTVDDAVVGVLPRLGLGLSTQEEALDRKAIERLRVLHLSHLRVDLDFSQPDWDDHLRRAADEADAVGCRLEVALHLSANAEATLQALRSLVQEIRPPVLHWLVFHLNEPGMRAQWIDLARHYLGDYDNATYFGAGTNAYFTELNRNRPDIEAIDRVCYSINPQVHAFDNLSLVETLPVQATTVESARAFVGDRPMVISPITLRPRFNPNATGADAQPAPDELPSQVDERQMSLFAAAWTVGSLKSLAESGVESITLYETVGWRGVMETENGSPLPERFRSIPGAVYPVYHIFADVAGCAGAPLLSTGSSNRMLVDGFAFRRNGTIRILLANLTHETQDVVVEHGGASVYVRLLTEHNAEVAMVAPDQFRNEERPSIQPTDGRTELRLLPYAVACLDVEEA